MSETEEQYKVGDIIEHSIKGLGVVVSEIVDGAYGKNAIVIHWLHEGTNETVWKWAITIQPIKKVS